MRVALRSAICPETPRRGPGWRRRWSLLPPEGAKRGSLRHCTLEGGGHVKVMLACSHSLSYDHQGFRPYGTHHIEAAGPMGPAVACIQVHCKLQTVTSCALATASMAVMEVMNIYIHVTTRERGGGSSCLWAKAHTCSSIVAAALGAARRWPTPLRLCCG